jgi:hypothetical protein
VVKPRCLKVCVSCRPETTRTQQAILRAIQQWIRVGSIRGIEILQSPETARVVVSDDPDIIRSTYRRGCWVVYLEGIPDARVVAEKNGLSNKEVAEHSSHIVIAPYGNVIGTLQTALIGWSRKMEGGEVPPSSRRG